MKYKTDGLSGPFGYCREGDGKIVYLYNSDKIPFEAIEQIVEEHYTDTCEDEDGEEAVDWSEYDPSVIDTECGELEDDMSFDEIIDMIDGTQDPIKQFSNFLESEILNNGFPLIFIDVDEKTAIQLSNEKLSNVVKEFGNKLSVFVREYDHADDY